MTTPFRKTAPKLDFAAFLDLAAELGCVGIEPRNDLGRPIFDGIEPVRAGEMAHERGLRFIGLSEVYPFNDWNVNRRAAVALLIETAQAAGGTRNECSTFRSGGLPLLRRVRLLRGVGKCGRRLYRAPLPNEGGAVVADCLREEAGG